MNSRKIAPITIEGILKQELGVEGHQALYGLLEIYTGYKGNGDTIAADKTWVAFMKTVDEVNAMHALEALTGDTSVATIDKLDLKIRVDRALDFLQKPSNRSVSFTDSARASPQAPRGPRSK